MTCSLSLNILYVLYYIADYMSIIPWQVICSLFPNILKGCYPLTDYISLISWHATDPLSLTYYRSIITKQTKGKKDYMTLILWHTRHHLSSDNIHVAYLLTENTSLIMWQTIIPFLLTYHTSLIVWQSTLPLTYDILQISCIQHVPYRRTYYRPLITWHYLYIIIWYTYHHVTHHQTYYMSLAYHLTCCIC